MCSSIYYIYMIFVFVFFLYMPTDLIFRLYLIKFVNYISRSVTKEL